MRRSRARHGFGATIEIGEYPTPSVGTGEGYLVNVDGGLPQGATAITVDTGTGTIEQGNRVAFAGHAALYTVSTALVTGSFEIAAPGLQAAIDDNVAVSVYPREEQFLKVAELIGDITRAKSSGEVEVSNRDSPRLANGRAMREFIPAVFVDAPTVSFSMNRIPEDPSHLTVEEIHDAGQERTWRLTWPGKRGAPGLVREFAMFLTSYEETGPMEDRMTCAVSARVASLERIVPPAPGAGAGDPVSRWPIPPGAKPRS